jgi:flagellar biosynthesis protein FlhB
MGAGDEAGEKKFDPTPSRLQRLRDQGQVPKSRELAQIATFVAAVMFLLVGGNYIWQKLLGMFLNLWSAIPLKTFGAIGPGFIIKYSVEPFAMIVIPLLLIVAATAIIIDFAQVGFLFTTQNFFKLDGFNPTNYFKRIFSVDGIVELLRQLLKVGILAGVAWRVTNKHWVEIIGLLQAESVAQVSTLLRNIILDFTIQASVALLVLAIADFFFQRFRFTQRNRMTLKEMIDEMKQNEGDPMVKAQRRALARRLNQRRQIADVPEADFITTNPSKIAVAIKYTSGQMDAPKVIAKGADAFAWRIIAVAKEHNVPVIENVPLARALFRLVKVGKHIPPELYRAVAEILLFAYQVRGKAKFR